MRKTKFNRRGWLPIFFLGLLLLGSSLAAWNTSEWKKYQGKLVVNGVEAASDSDYFVANMDYSENTNYLEKGHAYILEYAIELLRKDGYENWAALAQANLLDLNSGSSHADSYKGRVTLRLELEVLWGLFSTDLYEKDFTCVGGCEHYYTPSNNKGLDLVGYLQAVEFIEYLSQQLSAAGLKPLTFGLLNLHLEVSPDLQQQWPSGVALCQDHYDKAVGTWNEGDLLYPGHTSWESAMYELGWACHNIADLTVAQHLHNKFLGAHGDYEDLADGRGDENGEHIEGLRGYEENYHASSAKSAYHFSQNWTPTQLAKALATAVYQLPNNYNNADSDDTSARALALKEAIPLAEQYTAALIAQFMAEVGVPKKTPPLEGYVRISGGLGPLAGAYVFYGLTSLSPIEQNVNISKSWQGWSHVRADANGYYSITVKPGYRYWIRPAMPGYRWVGTTEANLEFGEKKSAVNYTPRSGMTSSDSISFYLSEMPKVATIEATPIVLNATVHPWKSRIRWESTRTRLIKPNTALLQSAAAVSTALSGTIQQSLMKTAADESVLEVKNGGTKLAEETFVTVTLSNLIDVYEAKTLTSATAILDAIDLTCQARKSATMKTVDLNTKSNVSMSSQKLAAARFLTREQWLAVKAKLPSKQITGEDGKTRNVYLLSANAEGSEGAAMLLKNGLVAIPSRGGAQIEISAVSGTGLLTHVKPITLTTNAEGKTAFYVRSGSHAGKLRLHFNVVKNPEAVQVLPSDNLDIMVHPPLQGFDPATETAPLLVPAIMDMYPVKKAVPPTPKLANFEGTVTLQPEKPQLAAKEPLKGRETLPPVPVPPARSDERRAENFDRDPILGWEFHDGARLAPGEAGRVLDCRGDGHGAWMIEPICDFELNFRFRPGGGWGEIIFRMGGEPPQNRQYALRLSKKDIFLTRRAKGEEKPLCRAAFAFSPGQWVPILLFSQGTKIVVFIGGQEVLNCRDPRPLPPGNIAFGCRQGEGIAFDDIQVTPLEKPEGAGLEPKQPLEPQSREMEPPPPNPQGREIEPLPPPKPPELGIEPPLPPEPQPQQPQPSKPPESKPPLQPQTPRPSDRLSPQPGPVNISGSWRSSRDYNYRISQQGDQFTWDVPAIAEKGSGTINGRSVTASWSGRIGSGSAHGTVEVAADGRATAIRWDNDVIFRKQN